MSPQNTVKDCARLIYYFSQNTLSFIGVVLTTSSAITLIAFWIYDFVLPGPPHPYIGLLIFLVLPGIFILGLLLIPLGVFLRRGKLRNAGELPSVYPEIDLKTPAVQKGILFVAAATFGWSPLNNRFSISSACAYSGSASSSRPSFRRTVARLFSDHATD